MMVLAAGLFGQASAASLLHPGRPDPLLVGTKGPCDPELDQPDYVAGVDATGNPVVPADVPAARNPVPDEVLVPLKRRGRGERSVAALDGQALEPLLNPAPDCPIAPR